jgi:hypothetical protein
VSDHSRACGQLLYGDYSGEPVARCIVRYGVEHDHSDKTAHEAVERGLAITISPFERRALAGALPAKEIK